MRGEEGVAKSRSNKGGFMSDLRNFVVTDNNSPLDITGYWEPQKNICWGTAAKSFADLEYMKGQKTLPPAKAADEKGVIDTMEMDVNGDLLPDRFELVETKEAFLIRWQRGVVYNNTWENCGGGDRDYYGFEKSPQILGSIQKNPKLKTEATNLLWRIEVKSGEPKVNVHVYGAELLNGKIQGWDVEFQQRECPKESSSGCTRTPMGRCFQ